MIVWIPNECSISSRAVRPTLPFLHNTSVTCFNLGVARKQSDKVKPLFKNSIKRICDVSLLGWSPINPAALHAPRCYSVSHYLLPWKVNDGSECVFPPVALWAAADEGSPVWRLWSRYCFEWFWSSTDFLVEKDNDYCVCQTPCNMTRYGKELSMVKIPSKASAKYLAKKFNKTEQYIGWVSLGRSQSFFFY